MKYEDLNFPKRSNLEILAPLLSDSQMMELIATHAKRSYEERKIILPSESCLRKCIAYYLVKKHKGDFSVVMEALKKDENVLAKDGHFITNIKRLYAQREKEIKREIKNEKK